MRRSVALFIVIADMQFGYDLYPLLERGTVLTSESEKPRVNLGGLRCFFLLQFRHGPVGLLNCLVNCCPYA